MVMRTLYRAARNITMDLKRTSGLFGYMPHYPRKTNVSRLLSEVSEALGLPPLSVDALWKQYSSFSLEQQYRSRFGEVKTLCTEEAFVIFVSLWRYRPSHILEIGTQHGKSTRRILDMKKLLSLTAGVHAYDISDDIRYFDRTEATLTIRDLTQCFGEELDKYYPEGGCIFLDARPYFLLKEVISECLRRANWTLFIHDCGPGICNPRMTIPYDDPNISSRTGLWERHVLTECLNIHPETVLTFSHAETASHRLKIFSTCHGIALMLSKEMLDLPLPASLQVPEGETHK